MKGTSKREQPQPVDDHITVSLPRSALQIIERPIRVTQRSSEHVLGLPGRDFLSLAREFAQNGGECLHLGKLRSVPIDAFEDWLRRRRKAPIPKRDTDPEPLRPEDDLAHELGLEVAS